MPKYRFFRFLSIILLSALVMLWHRAESANSPISEDDLEIASAVLQHMSVSHEHYLYDNYLIEATVSNINPMKISHGIFDSDSILFGNNLNGLPQGMLSYRNRLVYLEPNSNVYAVEDVKFPNLYLRLISLGADEILKRYIPLVSGQSRISGKLVQVIKLIPKNRLGYSLVLCIDQNSGLLLQLDVVDKKGKLVKSFMSIHMDILESNPAFLRDIMATLPEDIKTVNTVEKNKDRLTWDLKAVPSNFDILATNKHAIRNNNESSEYMLISDGLTDVSIYLTEHKSEIRIPLSSLNGTTVFRQRVSDKYDVAVIGVIPPSMAKMIADNVELRK